MEGVEITPSPLHHHHSSIVQIGHPLARFLPFLDDVHPKLLPRQYDGLECVGQLVDVEHLDALKLRHPVEVVVGGENGRVHSLGQLHQLSVNLLTDGNTHVQYFQGHGVVLAQASQHLQPSPSPVST